MLALKTLLLSDCHSLVVPRAVGELSELRHLAVQGCHNLAFQDGSFMHNAFATTSIRSLTLSDCELRSVPYQVMATHLASCRKCQMRFISVALFPRTPTCLFLLPGVKFLHRGCVKWRSSSVMTGMKRAEGFLESRLG